MTQDTLTLRTAGTGDIAALDSLFLRSYTALLKNDYPPSALITAIPVMARAQPALVSSGMFFVVESAGRIVGAGGWSMQPPGGAMGQRGVGHIRHVATDPDEVRRGVGRTLLNHIMLHAKASGMAMMRAQSTLTAVPFYEAMGFRALGRINVPLRGAIDFPAMQMETML